MDGDGWTRLNLGCGFQAPDGWVNIDKSLNLLLDRVYPIKKVLRAAGFLTQDHMVRWPKNIRLHDCDTPCPSTPHRSTASTHPTPWSTCTCRRPKRFWSMLDECSDPEGFCAWRSRTASFGLEI